VKQAILAVPVQQRHTDFEICYDGRRGCLAFAQRFGVEDRLTALATGGW